MEIRFFLINTGNVDQVKRTSCKAITPKRAYNIQNIHLRRQILVQSNILGMTAVYRAKKKKKNYQGKKTLPVCL